LFTLDVTEKGVRWSWGLFFCSEAPGLVFSTTYQRGILAPSAFTPDKSGELRLPPLISREKDSGLPPVTTEKTSCPSRYCKLFDALVSKSISRYMFESA
jgi:hypothetical protein